MCDPMILGSALRFPGIAQTADEALRISPYRTLRRIQCESVNGALVLRGQLPSFYHRQLAQEAVSKVSEVVQIISEIEVR